MVEPVDRIIPDFAKAGANIISFHPEASKHVDRTIGLIHDSGCKAGLVFNPATSLTWLDHVLDKLDLVLVMSVNPGFGGQSFIRHSLKKIAAVRALLDSAGNTAAPIEVDGGVDLSTVEDVVKAGARWLVAGNAIFGTPDAERAARELKARAEAAA